ncbi:hypothetical protein BXZ70DRAFT_1010753 [Cristinia sonorae]|uniref:F-box domain-containing protein n=1 Tax=Cristinia sonorae TaxID=1940300 RepID=A0A8K0UK68_9AGAR|nr:hypothetical protein BXZ70DRAFT_1010753 [Cristinia sonorae]
MTPIEYPDLADGSPRPDGVVDGNGKTAYAGVVSQEEIALAFINTLPPETLVQIFKFVRQDVLQAGIFPDTVNRLEFETGPRTWRTFQNWISLLHVCHFWRDTMTDPSLWITIVVDHSADPLRLFTYFLDRVGLGTIPLRVHFDSKSEVAPLSIMQSYPQAVARLEKLRIRSDLKALSEGAGVSITTAALGALTTAAPLLKYLDITFCSWENDLPEDVPILFGNQMPCLSHLALENITGWSGTTFSNLTHLFLMGTQYVDFEVSLVHYEMLLGLLKSNTRLQVFLLSSPTPWIHQDMDETLEQVDLPNLKQMGISNADYSQIRRLLSNLVLPRDLCLSISGEPDEGETLTVFPEDTSRLHVLDDVTALQIDFSEPKSYRRTTSYRVRRFTGTGSSGSFHIPEGPMEESLEIYIHLSLRRLGGVLRNLTELWFVGPNVAQIVASGSVGVPDLNGEYKSRWRATFATFPSLEKLVLDNSLLNMVHALVPPDALEGVPGTPLPCPSLRRIWISATTSTLFDSVRGGLLDFAVRYHASVGRPFHEILIHCMSRSASTAQYFLTSWMQMGEEVSETLPGLVEKFDFVSRFPSFELPSTATMSCVRNGKNFWPTWREYA